MIAAAFRGRPIRAAFRRRPFGAAIATLLPWLAASSGLPAQAQEATPAPLNLILILDASGSMWAPVPIRDFSRFAAAQRVVGELVDRLPERIEVGLVVYGHRRRDDCLDIETVTPLGPFDRVALKQSVNALVPKGKTPLASAIRQVFDMLRQRDDAAIVVLLTDGIGTCGGDLVADVQAARDEGLDFALEIVGFYVPGEDAGQLEAAAGAGCGRYFGAGDADQLAAALDQAVLTRIQAVSTVRDEFDFSPFAFGDHGTAVWRFPWRELGEQDGPGDGGEIEIEVDSTCFDGPCLNVEADAGSAGVGVVREVDLSGVDSATLSFVYGHDGDAGSEIVLEVSSDAGIRWATLETFALSRTVHGQLASFDQTPWAAQHTQIRFRVTVAEWGDLGVDDIAIEYLYRGETGAVRDEFNVYSGQDGSRLWHGPWIENDDDDPEFGAVRVKTSPRCFAGQCLKLKPAVAGAGANVYRQVDLAGAVSATLSYRFEHALLGSDAVAVEVSGDGGASYTVLETYTANSVRSAEESFDVSSFVAADTRVRFRVAGNGPGQGAWIDDLEIEFADPGSFCKRQLARNARPPYVQP